MASGIGAVRLRLMVVASKRLHERIRLTQWNSRTLAGNSRNTDRGVGQFEELSTQRRAELSARRSWQPDSGFPWRAAQQRDARVHHRSRRTVGTQGQRQGGQTQLPGESTDGEPQRIHREYGSVAGYRDGGTICGTVDDRADSGDESSNGSWRQGI